jgi:16S rRNA C967 or C1407 C5-methylase (RsmB/RsmF family)
MASIEPTMKLVKLKLAKPSQQSLRQARLRREFRLQEERREEIQRPIRAKIAADKAEFYRRTYDPNEMEVITHTLIFRLLSHTHAYTYTNSRRQTHTRSDWTTGATKRQLLFLKLWVLYSSLQLWPTSM